MFMSPGYCVANGVQALVASRYLAGMSGGVNHREAVWSLMRPTAPGRESKVFCTALLGGGPAHLEWGALNDTEYE